MQAVEQWTRDVGHAARGLMRTPGFTVTVVITLALAIGANAAIFSIIKPVLLAPLPYPNADRLVHIGGTAPGTDQPLRRRRSAITRGSASSTASMSSSVVDQPTDSRSDRWASIDTSVTPPLRSPFHGAGALTCRFGHVLLTQLIA